MKNAEILKGIMNANETKFKSMEAIHEFRWGQKAVTLGRFEMNGESMDLMTMVETPDFDNCDEKTLFRAYLDKTGESTLTLVAEYQITDDGEFINRNNRIDSTDEVKAMVDAMVRAYKIAKIRAEDAALKKAMHLNKTRIGVGMAPMFV